LAQALKVWLSVVTEGVKEAYVGLCFVLLDRRRFQSGGVKEITHLESGQPPLPVMDNFERMHEILDRCVSICGFQKIRGYTLWYAIVLMLGNSKLISNQLSYCKNDIEMDFPGIESRNLIACMREQNKFDIKEINYSYDLDYSCFVSMEDTSDCGGYRIPEHLIGTKVLCSPKYVVSQSGIDMLKRHGKDMCPLCYSTIDLDSLEKVGPKTIEYPNIELSCWLIEDHQIVDLKEIHSRLDFNRLRRLNELNFKVVSYEFRNIKIITKQLMSNMIVVRDMHGFMNRVRKEYEFVLKLDMTNICIAGGFCKSLLLDSFVNDIDFFFYGLDDLQLDERINILKTQIIESIKDEYPGMQFMMLYKQNNNVFEILCYEKSNINTTKYKIQIILTKNVDIRSILNNFDMYPCDVAFDGLDVYFTDGAYYAYKYMINYVYTRRYSEMFDARLQKYFEYGFSIALADYDYAVEVGKLQINKCTFDVEKVCNNIISISDFNAKNEMNTNKKNVHYEKIIDEDCDQTMNKTIKYINKVNEDGNDKIFYKVVDCDSNLYEYDNGITMIKFVDQIGGITDFNWFASHSDTKQYASCDEE